MSDHDQRNRPDGSPPPDEAPRREGDDPRGGERPRLRRGSGDDSREQPAHGASRGEDQHRLHPGSGDDPRTRERGDAPRPLIGSPDPEPRRGESEREFWERRALRQREKEQREAEQFGTPPSRRDAGARRPAPDGRAVLRDRDAGALPTDADEGRREALPGPLGALRDRISGGFQNRTSGGQRDPENPPGAPRNPATGGPRGAERPVPVRYAAASGAPNPPEAPGARGRSAAQGARGGSIEFGGSAAQTRRPEARATDVLRVPFMPPDLETGPTGAVRTDNGWSKNGGHILLPPKKTPVQFRHELKYLISETDELVLRHQLCRLFQPDPYGDENNEYHVRSLYFDDMYETALLTKQSGTDYRNKYRIRIYKLQDKMIKLERKTKRGDGIYKVSAPLTRAQCDQILAGDTTGLATADHPLVRDLFLQMTTRRLRPVVIVDYVREAYLLPWENVRITLDKRLRTGHLGVSLFDAGLPTIDPLDHPQTILEVKYDNYLPQLVPGLISAIQGTRSAVSKYVYCRRFQSIPDAED